MLWSVFVCLFVCLFVVVLCAFFLLLLFEYYDVVQQRLFGKATHKTMCKDFGGGVFFYIEEEEEDVFVFFFVFFVFFF